ncbi:MAG: DUF5050 domain-containing protein [Ruminiclostridium sp.]|nr:DUF5050 domain-containing protein [Ruminiclostridium sp.]
MKKLLACILSLAMLTGLLSGCGGGGGETSVPGNALTMGYWVADSMVMEGTEFTNEDMTGIFGPGDAVLTLAFQEDNTFTGVMFEEPISGTYTEAETGYKLDMMGETVTASLADGILTFTLTEGTFFTLVNQEEMPEALAKNPWATYDPNFTIEETYTMGNFMGFGWYYIEDNVLYGLTHTASNDGSLGATPFYMTGDFPEFEETTVLDDRGPANYLTKIGDHLYYTLNGNAICRMMLDGSGKETLYQGACDYLFTHQDRLYFTDEDYCLVSTDLDGKDMQTVVNKEIYYPYFISSDWLIFQDDADNESLHLYNTTYGTEFNLTEEPSFNPVLDGHWLYFTQEADGLFYLSRIDMSDPENFPFEQSEKPLPEAWFMVDEAYIYGPSHSVTKDLWKDLTCTTEYVKQAEMYVGADYTIHHELDENGLITGKYLMSKARNGGSPFP